MILGGPLCPYGINQGDYTYWGSDDGYWQNYLPQRFKFGDRLFDDIYVSIFLRNVQHSYRIVVWSCTRLVVCYCFNSPEINVLPLLTPMNFEINRSISMETSPKKPSRIFSWLCHEWDEKPASAYYNHHICYYLCHYHCL